jgi:hypothetical protein
MMRFSTGGNDNRQDDNGFGKERMGLSFLELA